MHLSSTFMFIFHVYILYVYVLLADLYVYILLDYSEFNMYLISHQLAYLAKS